jgi:hypothetical protein
LRLGTQGLREIEKNPLSAPPISKRTSYKEFSQ